MRFSSSLFSFVVLIKIGSSPIAGAAAAMQQRHGNGSKEQRILEGEKNNGKTLATLFASPLQT